MTGVGFGGVAGTTGGGGVGGFETTPKASTHTRSLVRLSLTFCSLSVVSSFIAIGIKEGRTGEGSVGDNGFERV